jgi:3-phosphoshikimate 1-carboxyvinyltransferase
LSLPPAHPWSLPLSQLPDPLAVPTVAAPFALKIRPPGSKSLTNRAVLLAAMARGTSSLRGPLLDADDAERMVAALRALGASIDFLPAGELRITGVDGTWRIRSEAALNLNNAGTATRFLAAAALLAPAPVIIDGNARMRQRPIGELTSALQRLGASIDYLPSEGGLPNCPPIRIHPPTRDQLNAATEHAVEMPTTQSSQFISALLMLGPWLASGITIRLTGTATSASYIRMTLGLLDRLGATVRMSDDLRVMRVAPPAPGSSTAATPAPTSALKLTAPESAPESATPDLGLDPFTYDVEPDASGATYFWAAAALVPGSTCDILDLPDPSLQGDANFVTLLEDMGCAVEHLDAPDHEHAPLRVSGPRTLRPITADMADMPDAAMTLAVVASFARGTTTIRGIRTLRVKETDRAVALKTELAKIGVAIDYPLKGDEDAMSITPPPTGIDCSPTCPRVDFHTYDDHRMAMALALVGLRRPNTFIKHPQCVAKTYPTYWKELAQVWG